MRFASRSVLLCVTLVVVTSCSSGDDEESNDVLDTSAAVEVLEEIRQRSADAGLDGGNDLVSNGECPLLGSFTAAGEWSAEAGGTIFCSIEGTGMVVVGLNTIPLESMFENGSEATNEVSTRGGTLVTHCPVRADGADPLPCLARWTNDEITVGVIALVVQDGIDPRLVLEGSLEQVVQSLADFDPEASLEFVAG